jgi:Mg/Co/Ni transporter MgtE
MSLFVPLRARFDPAGASASFVATPVDVTGVADHFSVVRAIPRQTSG